MTSVQLPLGFTGPSSPVTLRIAASGARVLVDVSDGTAADAYAYLAAAGCEPDTAGPSLSIPTSRFTRLARLPEQVLVLADPALAPLLDLLENPPDDDLAAELEVAPDGVLWMRWVTAGHARAEPLSPATVAALLTADIPFVASDVAFETMRATCHLPLLIGRCTADRSGFVSIETSKPQLVEASGLPGLFRISETRYGLPLAKLPALQGRAGFVWEGPAPRIESGPRVLPAMPVPLSKHSQAGLRGLVDSLAAYGTQLICWDSGLGRRVFALAALAALDAFPALVVCRPDRLWQWWRHAGLFGRNAGDVGSDLRLVTYQQFAANPALAYEAQAVIFDDVSSAAASHPDVAAAAVGVALMLDCYLIGITDALPATPRELVSVMSRLRPAEFDAAAALVDTYGTRVNERLHGHVGSYLSTRHVGDDGVDPAVANFNHTQVLTLELPESLRQAYDALASRHEDAALAGAQARLVSAGTRLSMSPKVGTALDLASEAAAARRRVAVVASEPATELLAKLLRPWMPSMSTEGGARVRLVRSDLPLPDLSSFDDVVVVDYPDSFAELDVALGVAHSGAGPSRVTCLHIPGTVDDALAVHAARQ